MQGIKHLIQCHCILPQYKNRPEPFFHKFVVFSTIDEKDEFVKEYKQCQNCGVIHYVVGVCESEIVSHQEELSTLTTREDIMISLPEGLCKILDQYDCDLPAWEHAKFIFDNKKWDEKIMLTKSETATHEQGKFLKIHYFDRFSIETFESEKFLGVKND